MTRVYQNPSLWSCSDARAAQPCWPRWNRAHGTPTQVSLPPCKRLKKTTTWRNSKRRHGTKMPSRILVRQNRGVLNPPQSPFSTWTKTAPSRLSTSAMKISSLLPRVVRPHPKRSRITRSLKWRALMRIPFPHLVMKGRALLPPMGTKISPPLVLRTTVWHQPRPIADSPHQLPPLIHGEGTATCAKWIV